MVERLDKESTKPLTFGLNILIKMEKAPKKCETGIFERTDYRTLIRCGTSFLRVQKT